MDDGLLQNAGLALLQERQGYLWIGTQDGLNRYDGRHITHFRYDPDNPQTISANSIIALNVNARELAAAIRAAKDGKMTLSSEAARRLFAPTSRLRKPKP